MTINTNLLVVAPSLEMYFVDKTTGAPLSSGLVYFYSQTNTSVLKNIYDQNGNILPNPIVLSSVGTFQDVSGNNIIPYYYPFDPITGKSELYYIKVYSSTDGITPQTLQFTRTNWPPPAFAGGSNTPQSIPTYLNEIPNGQFISHNNGPVWGGLTTGQIVNNASGVYNIAQGGWTFERPSGSAAVDLVTFSRFNSSTGNPTGNPRYALNVNCTSASGADLYKRICIKFLDVNKFSATNGADNQGYTFAFTAVSTGSPTTVSINILQNYGTGGSAPSNPLPVSSPQAIGTTGYAIYPFSFQFPTTVGNTIGTLDDDYVQVAIYLPTSSTFNVSFTDFILTYGNVSIGGFLDETDSDMFSRGVAGAMPVPDPNGMNLYLPLVLTPSGVSFSNADIGKIYAAEYETLSIGELDCNGTQYLTSGYSTDGIPYARLQSKWFDTTNNANLFGNGSNYTYAGWINVTPGNNSFRLNVTSPGSATITDVNTTFTFTSITGGVVTGCTGYLYVQGAYVIDNAIGARTAPTAGTSGFTVTDIRNTSNSQHVFSIAPVLPITAGTYFTFVTGTGTFYVWFKVNGAGADPAPGGTGIEVDVLSTYTVNEISRILEYVMSGNKISSITPLAGSAVVAGSNFTITTPTPTTYYVWYTVNGVGTDPQPAVSSSLKIKVNVLSTDTIAQVTTKTITAVNMKYFAVPDLRGQFLRGWDASAGIDTDIANRFGIGDYLFTNLLGTYEIDDFFTHLHAPGTLAGIVSTTDSSQAAGTAHVDTLAKVIASSQPVTITGSTASTGGTETTPKNFYTRWVVKY